MRSFRASRVGKGGGWQVEIIADNGQILERLGPFKSRQEAEAEVDRLTRAEMPQPN